MFVSRMYPLARMCSPRSGFCHHLEADEIVTQAWRVILVSVNMASNTRAACLSCCSCERPFEKGQKGYARVSVASITSPATVKKLFPGVQEVDSVYLCSECMKVVRSKTKVKKAGSKKRTWSERATPVKFLKASACGPTSTFSPQKKKRCLGGRSLVRAAEYFENHKYLQGFRALVHLGSIAIRKAFTTVFCEMLKKERRTLLSTDLFPCTVSEETISSFTWTHVTDQLRQCCPATASCLRSLVPNSNQLVRKIYGQRNSKRRMTDQECEMLINKRLGVVLAIILYTSKPKRFKFLQVCVGVQLWRHGSQHTIFHLMHELGLSQEVDAARGYIDRLRLNHNSDIVKWKKAVESGVGSDVTDSHPSCRKELFSSSKGAPDEEFGYGVCWDNVQISAHRKHQSSKAENTFHLWGMCLAVKNRVAGSNIPFETADDQSKAKELSPYSFLPSPEDYHLHKQHMVVLIERVLVENMSAFSELKKCVEWHIQHRYSEQMNQTSDVVNLGVVDANPSSTSGCVEIMNHLNSFVPIKDGRVCPILCSGDGLSVERMIGAHRCRANAATESNRLEGLIESPQEFHKEILLMQDMMDLLFSGNSEASRGTLSQLKSFFRHKTLKKDVKDNVQHVWDMLQFATHAYIVLCAMTQLSMQKISDVPETFPERGNLNAQMEWLEKLAMDIAEFVWLAPDKEDVRKVAEALKFDGERTKSDLFPFCFCGEDKDDVMIQCCSALCKNSWCHLSCTDLQALPPEDEDWFCSTECHQDNSYVYCLCKTRKGGQMVQCHLKDDCLKHEWYHMSCLNQEENLPDKWYCSEDCALGSENDDSIQNYSKTLMWTGLNLLTRRDAVREGNGDQIVRHWKMDMLEYWNKKHYKYFIIGHQFLAGIAGFLPEKLANDLIWNRLANLSGRRGGNIGLDLVNELLNNDFKDMMKQCHGKYTAAQVDRCAQMGGAFGRKLDHLFSEHGLGAFDESRKTVHKKPDYSSDIVMFTEEFQEDGLLEYCPVRCHIGFEEFHLESTTRIRSPEDMGKRLGTLSELLDMWKNIRNCN